MLKYKYNKSLYKLSLIFLKFILVPALFIFFALIIISYYNFSMHKEQLKSYLASSLRQYSSDTEGSIQNTINIAIGLRSEESFMNMMSQKDISSFDYSDGMLALQSFSNIYSSLIDNVFVYSPKADIVISGSGKYFSYDYFNSVYKYESYSKTYWEELKFYDPSSHRILSPSVVYSSENIKNVIPVVFRQFGNMRFHNYFVVNLSLDTLMNNSNVYLSTPNTKFFILNKYNGELFSSSNKLIQKNIIDTELYKLLVSEKNIFDIKLSGKKHLAVAVSTTNSLIGYTYFAIVPYADIYHMQQPIILVTMIITAAFILLAVIFTLYYSVKLAVPLHQIADTLNISFEQPYINDSYSFFEHIKRTAADLFEQNNKLSLALPFAQRNYLINFLNSTDYTMDTRAQSVIRRSLPFEYNYFAAVVLQMYPTEKFYETYDEDECIKIQSGFYDVVRELFSEKFTIFCLPTTKESLYIILNLPEECTMEDIDSVINIIYSCLKTDTEYINLYIGKGGIYKDLNGLKKAYTEAISNLNIILTSEPMLTVRKKNHGISLGKNYEAKLFNDLISFDTDSVRTTLSNTLCRENAAVDKRSLKELYSQVLIIIFKVMKIKNIPIDDNKLDFEVFSEVLNKDADEIYRIILLYLDKISSFAGSASAKSSGNNMIEYINENFSDPNMSLEMIASKFNTTTSYVSLIIKNNLGIGFYKYLTGLRIERAKYLLDTTDYNIQEICDKSGFSSKQTFFRTFKSSVGMTPNAYRKCK